MTNWVYTRDIPFASHNPSSDQPTMQTNTNSIDSLIEEDHYSFNDNNGGYHKVIRLPPQVANPASIAGIGQVFTKTITGDEELFYESGLGVIVQLTNVDAAPVAAGAGRSFLPGGIVIEWGSGTTVGGALTQNFISAYSTVFYGNVTAVSTGDAIANLVVITNTDISVATRNNAGALINRPVFWMVIGIY